MPLEFEDRLAGLELPDPNRPIVTRRDQPPAIASECHAREPARVPSEYEPLLAVVALSDMYRQGAYQGGAFRTGLLENWLKATGMTDRNLPTFVAHPKY